MFFCFLEGTMDHLGRLYCISTEMPHLLCVCECFFSMLAYWFDSSLDSPVSHTLSCFIFSFLFFPHLSLPSGRYRNERRDLADDACLGSWR